MKMIPERFPKERRRNPKRWAEARVFDALAQSGRVGCTLYEWAAPAHPHQLDFALWLTDTGRFAVEVKGGRYTLNEKRDQWQLHTRYGNETKRSPLEQVTFAARDLRREIRRQAGFRVVVIPVVVFTDMAPDPAIERRAQRDEVQVIWGTERLMTDLETLARRVEVKDSPRANHVRNEVRAVTIGTARFHYDRVGTALAPPVGPKVFNAANVSIRHVAQLIIRPAPYAAPNPQSPRTQSNQEVP